MSENDANMEEVSTSTSPPAEQDVKMEQVSESETKPVESAGPSAYEYVDPEQARVKTPPTEEEQVQSTLNAIEEIPSLMEKLAEDNTQYEVHVQLINALKQSDMPEQLEEARRNMQEVYPLTEALWLDWINDAKKEADTVEGEQKLRELYELAERDYLSIPIWKSFVEFVLEKFYKVFGDEETGVKEESEEISILIESTRSDLLKAVSAVTYHVKSSQEIWKPFSQFELAILNRFKEDEQKERMEKIYLDRLKIVHIDCDDTFSAYSTFVSQWNNANYEDTMVKANKNFARTKAAAEERDVFELQLVNSGYALDTFYQYIENEKMTSHKFSLNNVRCLYERAIAIYCTDTELWNDYILYLVEKARVVSFLKSVTLRALRNCPWSGTMYAHLTRFMESNNEERSDIIDEFDRALSNRMLLSSMEDLVTLLLAKCDYERRQIDWTDPDEDQIMNLRVAFEEALVYLGEAFPNHKDPFYRIEKYYAFIEDKRLGNEEKARELWQSVIESHGKDTEAYIQYIYFERDHHDYGKCQSLFKLALSKRVDNPARLIDVWNTIQREIGSIQSYEECLVRSNKENKFLTRKWQVQAAQEEVRAEKENEKKENEKRKKGLHRMEQKKKKQQQKAKSPKEAPDTKKEEKEKETEENKPKQENQNNETPVNANTAAGPSNALKRKASMDHEEDTKRIKVKESEIDEDGFRKPNLPFRPRSTRGGASRGGRGGRGGKGGLVVPSRQSKTESTVNKNEDSNSSNSSGSDKTNNNSGEKSNDDFRAFLLGNKK